MKYFNSVIAVLFLTTTAFGQNSVEAEKQIKNLITESFDEIFSKLNAKKMDDFYTKDFLLLDYGIVWNRDSISNYCKTALKESNPSKRINNFEFIDVKISGDLAWMIYKNYAVWKRDNEISGKAQWLESAVAILTKEGWKLQMLHSTYIETK